MEAILGLLVAMAPAPVQTTCGNSPIYITIRGDYVSLRCSRGYCNGRVPSQMISVRENCDSTSLTFEATGTKVGETIYGYCRNGYFDASIPMSYVNLRGTCSDGSAFRGKVQRQRLSIWSRCEEDGTSFIRIPSQSARVGGVCY